MCFKTLVGLFMIILLCVQFWRVDGLERDKKMVRSIENFVDKVNKVVNEPKSEWKTEQQKINMWFGEKREELAILREQLYNNQITFKEYSRVAKKIAEYLEQKTNDLKEKILISHNEKKKKLDNIMKDLPYS